MASGDLKPFFVGATTAAAVCLAVGTLYRRVSSSAEVAAHRAVVGHAPSKLILGSSSKYRKALLKEFGFPHFEVVSPGACFAERENRRPHKTTRVKRH